MALENDEGGALLVWRTRSDGTKQEITEEVALGGGRANPFGWSASDLIWQDQSIGTLYCGYPDSMEPGFTARWSDEEEEEEAGEEGLDEDARVQYEVLRVQTGFGFASDGRFPTLAEARARAAKMAAKGYWGIITHVLSTELERWSAKERRNRD